MNRLSARLRYGSLACALLVTPAFSFAGENPDWSINYFFDGVPVIEGLSYEFPLGNPFLHYADYRRPGGYASGNFYQGKFQEGAVRLNRHGFGQGGMATEYGSDYFPSNGDYFVVIYSTPPFLSNEHLEKMDEWFKNGTANDPTAFPPSNWGIVRFQVGPANAAPSIQNLAQYRQFGVDTVTEGSTFVGNSAVFKADISDSDSAQVKLEIEVKPHDIPFDGTGTLVTATTSPATLELAHDELIPTAEHYQPGGNVKSFHWRARAVDGQGAVSAWQEFGTSGNTDFTAKVVPLWTQKISGFPSTEQTESWAPLDYANGAANKPGDCGLSIAQCGCAITSAIMVAQYLGLTSNYAGEDITPLNLNNWLLENSSHFVADGSFAWSPMEEYTGGRVKYRGDKRFDIPKDSNYQNTSADFARVDEYVAIEQIPVISMSAGFKNHGGIYRTHFFVIDSKVGTTYTVRDPYWYGTKTLADATSIPNLVRRYEGGFDGLRIYEPSNGVAYTPRMTHTLGSPAELFFTDAQGRRLGKDPRTGQTYNEIPGGNYFVDARISNPDENVPDVAPREANKVIELENPPDGAYALEVIGTGTGSYSLISTFTDVEGGATSTIFFASTSPNMVSSYRGGYSATSTEGSTIKKRETAQDVFNQLKLAVETAIITPEKLKTTIKVSVIAAEKLYQSNKITLAKLALKTLKEVVKSKRGKGIAPADADKLLALIDKLLLLL